MVCSHTILTCGLATRKSSKAVFLKLHCVLGMQPWGCDKMQILTQQVWGEVQDSVSLPSSQVVPVLLVKTTLSVNSRTTLANRGTTSHMWQTVYSGSHKYWKIYGYFQSY